MCIYIILCDQYGTFICSSMLMQLFCIIQEDIKKRKKTKNEEAEGHGKFSCSLQRGECSHFMRCLHAHVCATQDSRVAISRIALKI